MAPTDMAETRAAALVSSNRARPDMRSLRRFLVDFSLALAAFAVAAGLIGVDASNAFPLLPPPDLNFVAVVPPPTMVAALPTFPGTPEAPNTTQTLALLALAFATLVATNLAIGRHLLRVYASPRRRGWRKG